jgi:hypothetical protein
LKLFFDGASAGRQTLSRKRQAKRMVVEWDEWMVVDKSPERVRRMFGQFAGLYYFLNHVLSVGIDL